MTHRSWCLNGNSIQVSTFWICFLRLCTLCILKIQLLLVSCTAYVPILYDFVMNLKCLDSPSVPSLTFNTLQMHWLFFVNTFLLHCTHFFESIASIRRTRKEKKHCSYKRRQAYVQYIVAYNKGLRRLSISLEKCLSVDEISIQTLLI